MSETKFLFIEPFYGGSHKVLLDTLSSYFTNFEIIALPAKKWHWRARCGALMLFEKIPKITNTNRILFCSSVLNLSELLGIRPDLSSLKKVVYFHENQLVYPVREIKARDIQYSYNQIMTCLAADVVLFNSHFNQTSFLVNIKKVLNVFPDNSRPKTLKDVIANKSRVIYFPVSFPVICEDISPSSFILHIIWPHRWEFDKGPEEFVKVLYRLKDNKVPFQVSILGETFTDNPEIFLTAKEYLKNEIKNFGYLESKDEYFKVLQTGHVVVSTAHHEFFGVSTLEATYCGCYPLVPNSLVYPEIYPIECLYTDLDKLYNKLEEFCLAPQEAVSARRKLQIDFNKYRTENVILEFKEVFNSFSCL